MSKLRGKLVDGPVGSFLIPESDHPRTLEVCEQLTRQVWDGEYDHASLPKDAVFILDIGAGWGAFSVWALKRWPECRLDAYEPNAKAIPYLRRNILAAPNSAMIEKETEGSVVLTKSTGLDNHVASVMYAHKIHEVAVTTNTNPKLNGCEDWGAYALDLGECAWSVPQFHPEWLPMCDVLKVDCEGCEVEVLEHYKHLRHCGAVLLEFHSPEKRDRARSILEAAGFWCGRESLEPYGVAIYLR